MNAEGGFRRPPPKLIAARQPDDQHRFDVGRRVVELRTPSRRRRGQQLSQRATTQLLELERTLNELAVAGDVEYLAATLALALARLDRHFAKPYAFVLKRWGLAA